MLLLLLLLLLLVFLPYQTPYLAKYGPLACFGPTRGLRPACQPAPIQSFRRVAEYFVLLLLVFLPYQTPYLAEYGPLACFGPTRTPLFNRSAELRNFLLPGCHIKSPISPSTGPLAWAAKILPLNKEYGPLACFGPTRGLRPARQPAPYSIINSAELCILPRRPARLLYQIPPISRVRPIHVGGISDVLCVCVCLHTHTHTHLLGGLSWGLGVFPTDSHKNRGPFVFVFVCLCAHKHTNTHIYSGARPGDLAFFSDRPTQK
jgi:hypothetical protein